MPSADLRCRCFSPAAGAVASLIGLACTSLGCATGTQDDFELTSGMYELSTVGVAGDCTLDNAITEGGEFEGKVVRVNTEVNENRVSLDPCNAFFKDACFPVPTIEQISMLRDASDLRAANDAWPVPGCTCFENYRATRRVDGVISEDGRAELTWTFELPAAPDGCTCSTSACTMQIEQTLTQPGPLL